MADISHPSGGEHRHRPPLRDTPAHEHLIAEAEAKRLLHALAPYGILSREALEHECHAHSWHDGGFSAALKTAISSGMIDELPGGFYRDARLRERDAPLRA
ncbi:MAG TPA: hypothetical protein VKV21_12990 [Solirubrobacteraceae bacterium]|nr:hypothetical protein [Solirubrobacteraceae bacterium]